MTTFTHCPHCNEVHVANYKCNAQYMANNTSHMANSMANNRSGVDVTGPASGGAGEQKPLATYRYRDPEKRQAYMREYMRKKRETAKRTIIV
jgi:hypothetical protein